jgi:hypothetical protein
MSKNGQDIRRAMQDAKLEPEKKNPFRKDVIVDPMGQWKYPGQVTKIPSNQITMQGVPYPVLGVDDLGNQQMMFPGMEYQFAGQHVTEYPMPFGGQNSKTGTHFEGGGWLDEFEEEFKRGGMTNPLMRSRSKRATTKKNIQSSINKIFLRNKDIFGPGGKNVYDPKSKYQMGGGWLDNLE